MSGTHGTKERMKEKRQKGERKKGSLRGLVRVEPDLNWLALTDLLCCVFFCDATAQLRLKPPHC